MSDIEDRHKHILINFVICLHNHTTHFLHYSQQLCWKKQLWRQLHTTQTAHLEGGAQRDCEQRLTWSLTVVRHEITQFLLECVEPVCTYWSLHTVGDWSIKLSNWVNHKIEMNFTDSFKLESVKIIQIFGYCFGFFVFFVLLPSPIFWNRMSINLFKKQTWTFLSRINVHLDISLCAQTKKSVNCFSVLGSNVDWTVATASRFNSI